MATTDQVGEQSPLADLSVVDCDVHVMQPEGVQSLKAEYIDMPYRAQVDPEVSGLTGGYPSHGQIISAPGFQEEYTRTDSRGIDDPETDLRDPLMDGDGVDTPVLNMGPMGVDELLERDRQRQEMRATNNVLLDKYLDPNDDVYGLATVCLSQPEAAVEEIERVADEDQVVGLYATVSHVTPPPGDPKYDPVYEAAEDHGLPVAFHSGDMSAYLPRLDGWLRSYLESYSITHPTTQTIALASTIYEGVPVKFPDLDFLALGAGLGTVASGIGRLNRDYRQREFDAPLLENPPEEYVRDSWYVGTQPLPEYADPDHLRHLVDVVGADSLVFGSNFPLYDADAPADAAAALDHLSRDERAAVFHDNAASLFGL